MDYFDDMRRETMETKQEVMGRSSRLAQLSDMKQHIEEAKQIA